MHFIQISLLVCIIAYAATSALLVLTPTIAANSHDTHKTVRGRVDLSNVYLAQRQYMPKNGKMRFGFKSGLLELRVKRHDH